MIELTDEQFREARRQIVERLCARGRNITAAAVKSVEHAAVNHQNAVGPFVGDNLDNARAFFKAAEAIGLMERDGYDWSRGIDE